MRFSSFAFSIVFIAFGFLHCSGNWITKEDYLKLLQKELAENQTKITVKSDRISVKQCQKYKNLIAVETSIGGGIFDSESEEDDSGLKQYNCSHFSSTGLITGGLITENGEFPHMAAIGWRKPKLAFSCGGSLISDKFVLSVAHCAVTNDGPEFVRLGDQNLASNKDKLEPVDYEIKNIIIHDDYHYFQKINDIALFELESKVIFTKYIRPACLSQAMNFQGKVIATGWGQTSSFGPTSEELMKVGLRTIEDERCLEAVGISSLHPGQVCVYGEGNKDTCRGDSGAPIQVSHTDAACIYDIIGMTSYGNYKCGSNSTALYTRVEPYIDWIERKVWGQ